MRLNILCDAQWEAKIDRVLSAFSDLNYRRFFEEKNYGSSLNEITIILMCQDPALNLKQRIRQSKKDKELYIDLMLDLPYFKKITQEQRNKIVVDKIINEVPKIISKYKFEDFELSKFEVDMKELFKRI